MSHFSVVTSFDPNKVVNRRPGLDSGTYIQRYQAQISFRALAMRKVKREMLVGMHTHFSQGLYVRGNLFAVPTLASKLIDHER